MIDLQVSTAATLDEADADEVWAAYVAVWPETDAESWRPEVWDRHVARTGFRLARVYDGSRLVGFAYGYTGARGQWWTDQVATTLPAAVAAEWLGGHFEVVSIGVLPAARGAGVGQRLMRVLCDVPHERLLLMTTDESDDPARRLYAALGWSVLGPGVGSDTVVMGRHATPGGGGSSTTEAL